MMPSHMKPIWFALLCCLLMSCGSLKIPCHEVYLPMKRQISKLYLPILIEKSSVAETLDRRLPIKIYDSQNDPSSDFDLIIERTGVPSLELTGKNVVMNVPLAIQASRELGFVKAKGDGKLFIKLSSDLNVDENWKMSTNTEVVGYEWIKEPKVSFAGISFSVKQIANRVIKEFSETATTQIDESLEEHQLLQQMKDSLLSFVQKPVVVDENLGLKVDIVPKSMSLSPFEFHNDFYKTAMDLEFETKISKDTALSPNIDDLKFEWLEDEIEQQDLQFHITIEDEWIEKISRDFLVGERFNLGKKEISIKQIYVDFARDKVRASVYIRGDYNGQINFEGKPTWDLPKEEIRFCDVVMDAKLNETRSKLVWWMFKRRIQNAVLHEMEQQFNDELRKWIFELNHWMKDMKFGEMVHLQGSVTDYTVSPIIVEKKSISLVIRPEVSLDIELDGIKAILR